jgi:hypothetical protein
MSINKNFVVRHGFEVSTDLILADADTRKVGVGTTAPQYTLHVNGGIGATDFYLTGIGTFVDELNVGLDGTVLTALGIGGSVGIGTALPAYLLDIRSPVSTGQTALYVQGDIEITGDIRADDAEIEDLIVTDTLFVVGLSTFNSNVFINAALNVSGITTLGSYVTINDSVNITDDLNVVGVATVGDLYVSDDLEVAGDINFNGSLFQNGQLFISGGGFSKWRDNTAGITTESSVGINTTGVDVPGLTGVGNSFQGLYVSNGMIIMDNTLNGNHYIGTFYNGLIVGPVNINGVLTIDGNYSIV